MSSFSALSAVTDRPHGNGQRLLRRPVVSRDSLRHGCIRQPGLGGPLGNGASLSAPRHQTVRPAIVRLLKRCGPAHVARLVVSVDANAIQRVANTRPWADVFKERLKVPCPFVAHFDAAPAVVRVRGIVTALLGGQPRSILRRSGSAVGALPRRGQLAIQTTAASRASRSKRTAGDVLFASAITAHTPRILLVKVFDGRQPAEPLARQIHQLSAHLLNNTTRMSL